MGNIQAEALLLKYLSDMQNFKTKKEEVLNQLDEEEKSIRKIKALAQEICLHPDERQVDDYNHHNGEDWVNIYCKVCDKYLRRF